LSPSRGNSDAVDAALGVVVLAYGSDGEYRPLLETLLAQAVPPSAIVVVQNPASPGEPALRVPRGCQLVQAERNLGYAGGMNLGIACQRERDVDFILLLTHDARLRSGALDLLLNTARRHPDHGALGPAMVWAGSDRPFSFGGITRANGTNAHVRERPTSIADGVFDSDWIDGGAMLLRSDILDRVGTFDERFWAYCEEAELCLRIRRAGYRIGVVVDALADQAPGGTKRPGAWAYLMTRNGIAFARRTAGLRGLATATARSTARAAFNFIRAGLRATRLRPGGPREPWALAVGIARGTVDYFRGRWGPPPPGLPGLGDLRNA
jgi:N-acetylglucosaminyl-diphospho-decaprenol L-rhamnosyltransferase